MSSEFEEGEGEVESPDFSPNETPVGSFIDDGWRKKESKNEEDEEPEFSFWHKNPVFGKYNLVEDKCEQKEITLYGYSTETESWEAIDLLGEKTEPQTVDTFIVATQNIWFKGRYPKVNPKYHYETRISYQLDTFSKELPHVVCLQEVIEDFTLLFSEHEGMMQNYLISENPFNVATFEGYGSALLIRKDLMRSVRKIHQLVLPSEMERTLIHCDIHLQDSEKRSIIVNIGSIHLESLRNPVYRRAQLRLISDHVQSNYENAILCGDFNFPCRRNYHLDTKPLENDFLKSPEAKDLVNYQDIWSVLKYSEDEEKDDPGYTKDSHKNKMLAMEKTQQFRYDRIMVKSKTFVSEDIKLVNCEEIEGTEEIVFPSDHFGVLARFKVK